MSVLGHQVNAKAGGREAGTKEGFPLSHCQESREGYILEKRRQREQGWASWTAAVRLHSHVLECYSRRSPQDDVIQPSRVTEGSQRGTEAWRGLSRVTEWVNSNARSTAQGSLGSSV